MVRSVCIILALASIGFGSPVASPSSAHERELPSGAATPMLYVLPIVDSRPTAERVQSVLNSLGRGGPQVKVGFSGVFRYMADVDPSRDYQIVTTRLEEIVAAARQAQAPFLVHLNGGRWAGGGPLVEHLARDPEAMAWDQLDRPWTYLVDGEYHFSLSAYNEPYRRYKERNLRAAAAWLQSFATGQDGRLLLGISTDSEVLLNLHPYYDYNPRAIDEFVDWLASRRVYRPAGRWQSDGQHLTLRQVNKRYGTNFRSWSRVGPPRQNDGGPFWRDWSSFRELLVDHSVQEQVDWITQAGLPADSVFSHQSPSLDRDVFGDTLAAAQVSGGSLGITVYGERVLDAALFAEARALSSNWGIMEYNPLLLDVQASLDALQLFYSFGPAILCPYHWDDLGGPNEVGYTIVGSPLEEALRSFVRQHSTEPPQ